MSKPIYLFSTSSHPDAISINSLSIEFLKPNIDFSNYDYLIITSKQTTIALKQYDLKEYIYKKALCVSSQSALSFEQIGGKVLAIGGGYGDNLEKIIKSYPKECRWLYLRAKEVASDFVKRCQESGYDVDEKVVYESRCSKDILNAKIDKNSILIFTSPSSVRCFLENHNFDKSHKVIVIGKTTAKAIPKEIVTYISDE
ncbi:MAG: uroporphyrinogen-III synthase, partial [Campylobacterales bacterium]|nr:uroporphyrinogen-III synthase [Campylobacterales bacterium]